MKAVATRLLYVTGFFGAAAVAFMIGFGAVLLLAAAISLIPAAVLMLVWNWVAPSFPGLPEAYRHFEFFQVWGFVVLAFIISRLLTGGMRVSAKEA